MHHSLSILLLLFHAAVLSSSWVIPIRHYQQQQQQQRQLVSIAAHSTSRRQWLAESATSTATVAVVATATGSTTLPAKALAQESLVLTEARTKTTVSTCDPAVSVWRNPSSGRKVYLLGTAHISDSSAQLAGQLVNDVRPDAVFIELDAKRIKRVSKRNDTSTTSTTTTSRSQSAGGREGGFPISGPVESNPVDTTDVAIPTTDKKVNLFDLKQRALVVGSAAVGGAIQGMYKKLNKSGFNPGEEFVIAIQEGQKVGAQIILGDRDVEVTLQRLTQALGKTDIQALLQPNAELEATMAAMMPSSQQQLPRSDDANFKEEMSVYVETMKAKENVKLLMVQLKRAAPELYEALVAERDEYMANGLDKLSIFPTIVAVMGIAHVDGVEMVLKSRGWMPVPLTCPTTKR